MPSPPSNNSFNVSCSGWVLLHIVCFINSLIMIWIIYSTVPRKDGFNPVLLFGIFPLLTSTTIHICYRFRLNTSPILPIYTPVVN